MKKVIDTSKKVAYHCETKKIAKALLRIAHDQGLKWCTGGSYSGKSNWVTHNKNTSYAFYEGTFTSKAFYKEQGYTIINAKEFLSQGFCKSDLRTGMKVELRMGIRSTVLLNTTLGDIISTHTTPSVPRAHWLLDGYSSDLIKKDGESCSDIVKVYDMHKIENKTGVLLWERDETPLYTVEELTKLVGHNFNIKKG